MDRNPVVRKGSAVIIICVLLLMSVPVMASNETAVNGSLLDKVPIECRGIYPIDIPLSLLNLPVYYIRVEFSNNNDVSINVTEVFKLETRAGKVLFEDTLEQPFPIPPHNDVQTQMFTRYTWRDKFNYRFGLFNFTLDFYIKDDGSHVKLLFHGLVFGFGTMIFNPKGEVIEPVQVGVR
ncbi:MAG: hypothetical protein JW840_07900 [Candidatus Thermoplasmatota archaeon]|nr:hypothetical protein [Candidatus Thermoplasmatota archaeon]